MLTLLSLVGAIATEHGIQQSGTRHCCCLRAQSSNEVISGVHERRQRKPCVFMVTQLHKGLQSVCTTAFTGSVDLLRGPIEDHFIRAEAAATGHQQASVGGSTEKSGGRITKDFPALPLCSPERSAATEIHPAAERWTNREHMKRQQNKRTCRQAKP